MSFTGRISTGIDGLDDLTEGGFIRGDVILVVGGTGTGKTIFSTQFICNGATRHGEKGVYVSFEEDHETLKRNMLKFGFDLDKLEHEGMIKVLDLLVLREEGFEANIHTILEALKEIDAKRLVIDSLTAFLFACGGKFDYRMIMHLFCKMLKMRNITAIMTCSIPTGAKTIGLGIEEFVADSLIVLENVIDNLELKTRILIRKMRSTNHSRKYHAAVIAQSGLKIMPFPLVL